MLTSMGTDTAYSLLTGLIASSWLPHLRVNILTNSYNAQHTSSGGALSSSKRPHAAPTGSRGGILFWGLCIAPILIRGSSCWRETLILLGTASAMKGHWPDTLNYQEPGCSQDWGTASIYAA